MNKKNFLNILNKELVIAVGCTEPISIAYAASLAQIYLKGKEISNIKVLASKNVVKNAMAVTIPGTDSCGIPLAASLGAIAGNADKELEVLSNLNSIHIKNAKEMINKGKVTFELSKSPKKFYVEVIIENNASKSRVIIEDSHTNITLIEADGEVIKKTETEKINEKQNLEFLNLNSIYDFIETVEINELNFITDSIEMNLKICKEGLNNQYGLQVGGTIKTGINNDILSHDMASYAVALTAAGSDARMSGSSLPVISNSGSGNQGISATIPVVVAAEYLNADTDKLLRSVTLSHLITIYIKSKFGRLSTLCGATVSATGACCGITYLLGGEKTEIEFAIQNMIGNVAGILCDGAKPGCALKVATCTNAAILSAQMAIQGIKIDSTQGIIEDDAEKTIENFCKLGNLGMSKADEIILDIMLKKSVYME
ncbi:MAG: L-cysteine desulfidase family protein [Methanobacterium sp.]